MKKTVTYGKTSIEYDDEDPCIVCGEPVISASMGGPAICGWCDCGNCRYGCGIKIFVYKEELDNGESKKAVLNHMAWHREREPEFNKNALAIHRKYFSKTEGASK